LELNDNRITGDELKKLDIYKESLNKLKISGNQISKLEDIAVLKSFGALMHLDIDENPIAKIENYREKIYETLPNLNVLDGKNKDGESVYSEEDYGDEGGEFDIDDDFEERINALP
jgi:Leucine-rich repeat (LRR) protein